MLGHTHHFVMMGDYQIGTCPVDELDVLVRV